MNCSHHFGLFWWNCHLFFSYFSCRNSFTFCGSGIAEDLSSNNPRQICLQTSFPCFCRNSISCCGHVVMETEFTLRRTEPSAAAGGAGRSPRPVQVGGARWWRWKRFGGAGGPSCPGTRRASPPASASRGPPWLGREEAAGLELGELPGRGPTGAPPPP